MEKYASISAPVKDTTSLENAYRQFGNVAYVSHWFDAFAFRKDIPPLKNTDGTGKELLMRKYRSRSGKPLFWVPCIQLKYRPAERLKMTEKLDNAIVKRNDRYPNIFPATAIDLERVARKKPQHDWRVEIISAFESLTYQRQGRKKWLLIEMGRGYA